MTIAHTGLALAVVRGANAGLGLLLSVSLAAVFGVSREVDALFLAMSIAVFLARDLSRVVRTAAVPCLVECTEGKGPADFPATFRWAVLGIGLLTTLSIWATAPWIVRWTSPGFDENTMHQAVRLLRWLSPSMLLFLLFGAAQGLFYAQRRFLLPELGETLWRAIAIGALFTLGQRRGIEGYAAGLLVAAFAQWLLLLLMGVAYGIPLWPCRLPRFTWSLLKPCWLGAVVVLCSIAQMQVEAALDRMALSFMQPGSLALLSHAQRLAHMMPLLLSTSLLLPWLPEIARVRAHAGDPRRLAKQGSLFLAALGTLLAIVVTWGARDAVQFLLLRGRFDAASANIVADAVRALAVGIPAIFCIQCLAGLFIVERNLREMIYLGLLAIVIHGLGNWFLRHGGVPGIAWSGTITVWLAAFWLWKRIRSHEPVWFAWGRWLCAMAVVVGVLYGPPWRVIPWLPVRLLAGGTAAWCLYHAVMAPALRRMQACERDALGQDQKLPAN